MLKQPWRDIDAFSYEAAVRSILSNIIAPSNSISSIVVYGNEGQLLGSGIIDVTKVDWGKFFNKNKVKQLGTQSDDSEWYDTHQVTYLTESRTINCISLVKKVFHTEEGRAIGRVEMNIDEKIGSESFFKGYSAVINACDSFNIHF